MTPFHTSQLPVVQQRFSLSSRVRQLIRFTRMELWETLKSPVFICLSIGVVLSVAASLSVRSTEGFGLSSLPVTFSMVEMIREALVQFQIVLITFYAGVFVWKERDSQLDEIFDSLPIPTWLPFVSKLIALTVVVVSVIVVGICCGLIYQLYSGFLDFRVGVYVEELLLIDMVSMGCLIVLAFLCHVVSPNKYIGYFLFIALVIVNMLAWPLLGIESRMVQFGNLPKYTYSDLFGRQPYASAIRWFALYWGLLAGLLAIVAVLLWPRGREKGLGSRLRIELKP